MIECEKGTVLCLEYEPGMFRKVTVEAVREFYSRKRHISIVGMTVSFMQEDGLEYRSGCSSRRRLYAFDQAKIDATKVEKRRRRTVKWLRDQDWNAYELERLEAVYAAATAEEGKDGRH
jgi:hypothetical protein